MDSVLEERIKCRSDVIEARFMRGANKVVVGRESHNTSMGWSVPEEEALVTWVGAHAEFVWKISAEEEIPLVSGICCSLQATECLHTDLGVILS